MGKFAIYKEALTNKQVAFKKRVALMDAVVTLTVLYGSGCWTMLLERETMAQTAQRRMLRMMLGKGGT